MQSLRPTYFNEYLNEKLNNSFKNVGLAQSSNLILEI